MIQDFLFIGHRGTRTNFDENTITAFIKSIEHGANCIEFDVRKTKDKKIVILHDNTLDRTTDGIGVLKQCTYNSIRNIKTIIHGDTIPLLSEVLCRLKKKTFFMVELKERNLLNAVINIVNECDVLDKVIFSGRYLKDLNHVKKMFSHSYTCFNITKGVGLNLGKFLKKGIEKEHTFNFDMVSLRSDLISKDFIEICHQNKIRSLSWNFLNYTNPIKKIKSLIELGIDGILFDNHLNIYNIKQWNSHR
ncbi:MAG: glycerophosphodiester phosphodiesterase [Promethearchaeota archaeon]|jgi:glycerophosphoryl diester phosphodiesterase